MCVGKGVNPRSPLKGHQSAKIRPNEEERGSSSVSILVGTASEAVAAPLKCEEDKEAILVGVAIGFVD